MRIEEFGPDRKKLFFDCPNYQRKLDRWLDSKEDGSISGDTPPPSRECHVLLKPWPIRGATTWDWNGDETAPTLTPSICCGDCGWHGFIQDGKTTNA